MRRKFSASLALLGVALGLALGAFAPMEVHAQSSILPGDSDSSSKVGDTELTTCGQLRDALDVNPKAVEGKALALKIRCGRMSIGDLPHYFKHILSFVLNTIGTLAVIAVIRAGYIFMTSKDKEYADGRKAVIQVIVGMIVAGLAFTAAQIVLRVLFAVNNASPV